MRRWAAAAGIVLLGVCLLSEPGTSAQGRTDPARQARLEKQAAEKRQKDADLWVDAGRWRR